MRTSINATKHMRNYARASPATSVVVHSRQDLTRRWMGRIQAKAKDSSAQENLMKLSSLIDFYNKPSQNFKDNIDWSYWSENIRSEGLVGKIQNKYEEFKTYQYNVDAIAQRSAINSEKFDNYGYFLKWNYSLWMKQYLENLHSINGLDQLGDISYITWDEFNHYVPGTREQSASWRETGHYIRTHHYFENSASTIIRRQFRSSNRSWMPYWHSVNAWERGFQLKHVLMSL